jgi:hypothetical protein
MNPNSVLQDYVDVLIFSFRLRHAYPNFMVTNLSRPSSDQEMWLNFRAIGFHTLGSYIRDSMLLQKMQTFMRSPISFRPTLKQSRGVLFGIIQGLHTLLSSGDWALLLHLSLWTVRIGFSIPLFDW